MIKFGLKQTRQPAQFAGVASNYARGLIELYIAFPTPGGSTDVPRNVLGRSFFKSIANTYVKAYGGSHLTGSVSGGGCAASAAGMYLYDNPAVIADLATGQVTCVTVLHSAAQDGTGDRGPLMLRGDFGSGVSEHYPYTDGKLYLSSYCENRWVSGVTPPVTLTAPHTIVISARAGAQRCYMAGVLIASGSRAEAPMLYDAGPWGTGSNGAVYFRARWNRVLSDAECLALSENPWQILAPRQIIIPYSAAGASIPTLSASTYVAGSLTSTGWRPQVTAS